jgi:hypothetical protein
VKAGQICAKIDPRPYQAMLDQYTIAGGWYRGVTQRDASFQTPRTLFLIASDLKRMQVDTNVSESDIGGIKEGADSELCRARPPSGG